MGIRNLPDMFCGMQIKTSLHLTKTKTTVKKWRRLNRQPKVRVRCYQVPDENLYTMAMPEMRIIMQPSMFLDGTPSIRHPDFSPAPRHNMIVGHPETIIKLRLKMEAESLVYFP